MGGEGRGEIQIYLSSHMHSHKCPFVLFFFGKREDIYIKVVLNKFIVQPGHEPWIMLLIKVINGYIIYLY